MTVESQDCNDSREKVNKQRHNVFDLDSYTSLTTRGKEPPHWSALWVFIKASCK